MRDLSELVCLWLSSVTFAGCGRFWDFPSSSEGVRGRARSPEQLSLPALGQLAAAPQPIQIRLHALPPPCLPLLIPPGIATAGFYMWISYFSTQDPGDYTVNSKGRVMLAWTTLLSLVLLAVLLNPLLQHLAQVKREQKPLSPFLLQESNFHIPSWRKDLYGIKMPTWFFPGSQASSPVLSVYCARLRCDGPFFLLLFSNYMVRHCRCNPSLQISCLELCHGLRGAQGWEQVKAHHAPCLTPSGCGEPLDACTLVLAPACWFQSNMSSGPLGKKPQSSKGSIGFPSSDSRTALLLHVWPVQSQMERCRR